MCQPIKFLVIGPLLYLGTSASTINFEVVGGIHNEKSNEIAWKNGALMGKNLVESSNRLLLSYPTELFI